MSIVLGVMIVLGYPVALMFGLPLAQRDMNDLRKWNQATVEALPPLQLPDAPTRVLPFADRPVEALLVRDGAPAGIDAAPGSLEEPATGGDADTAAGDGGAPPVEAPEVEGWTTGTIELDQDVDAAALVSWGPTFEAIGDGVYQAPAALPPAGGQPLALYAGNVWLRQGVVVSNEPPDGRRDTFTFSASDGPVVVDGVVQKPGEDYTASVDTVTFAVPPPFGGEILRVSRDYAILDADAGTIVVAAGIDVGTEVRLASEALRLAERLVGEIDGANRRFRLARTPVYENDRDRIVLLDDRPLSAQDERPEERVDGVRSEFTFASPGGVLMLEGRALAAGVDYERDGSMVRLARVPARNARLRQHVDYAMVDHRSGEILLADAPEAGSVLWAQRYTYYSEPGCGSTVIECFYALPQHPVPFPHWIAAGIGPFLTKYSVTDPRNVVRATAYTTLGTLYALLLGAAVGVLLAVVFVLFRPVERALLPWVIASQTVPIIALVPVMLLVLGNFGITVQTSLLPTAIIGAYIAFFPVVVSTVKGLRSVDPLALDLMRSYAATPWQVFRKVRFPAAVPFFFTSLKLGTAAALVGALVAETESNNRRGLGFQILGQVQSGNVADVWILLILSGLLGIVLVGLVGLLEQIMAPWRRA